MRRQAMWHGASIIVVVPALDEAPRIARVLGGMPPLVDRVIVVNDGSRDDTAARAREVGDRRVVVLSHLENRGVGAAIATGYRAALDAGGGERDAFVVMAGDGQMDPEDLPTLAQPIVFGRADYVKGDRFRSRATIKAMPTARYIAGRVFSRATSLAIGVSISDSQCGYTAISRAACAKLDLAALWPGYGYPNDMLSQLAVRGLRIAEVEVRAVYADEVSRLTLRHVPRVARIIARALFRRAGVNRLQARGR